MCRADAGQPRYLRDRLLAVGEQPPGVVHAHAANLGADAAADVIFETQFQCPPRRADGRGDVAPFVLCVLTLITFCAATPDSTDFDPANATVAAPAGWFVGSDPLSLDSNGDLVLSNISNVAQAQAVPEPQTIAIWCLLGLAVGGCGLVRRPRRK